MDQMEDEVPEILLCEVSNEAEAAMVVGLLREEEIPAHVMPPHPCPSSAACPLSRGITSLSPPHRQRRRARF